MFISCSPGSVAAETVQGVAPAQGGALARSRSRTLTVDLHCHMFVPAAADAVAEVFDIETDGLHRFSNQATREVNARQSVSIHEQLVDIDRRLADMDRMGIDMQAVSPVPLQYYYGLPPELGRTAARLINDEIAAVAAAHPERFVGLGGLPMQDPQMAVAELERVVGELGFKGIELCTNVNGEELSHERFRGVFAKAEELDALIFLHPNGFSDGARLSDHYFINVIGNPLDSTVAVSHLIFDGVLDRFPKLKICVAHGGGFLPAYSGRIDHAHAAREDCRRCIDESPGHYLRRLYFDTVVFTEHQLEYLTGLYGSDHIVLGTDYPFDMGMYDPVGFVNGAAALTDADKEAIVGGNAARLLGIESRRPSVRR